MTNNIPAAQQLWRYFQRGGLLLVVQAISYRLTGRDLLTPLVVPIYRTYLTATDSTVSYLGVDFDTSHEIVTDDLLAQFLTSYEYAEALLLDKYFDTRHDVIELGGGIGFISCYTASKLDSEKKHVVVEPNPTLLPIIENTRRLNSAEFDLLQAAYSPDSETVTLNMDEEFLSSSILDREDKSNTEEVTVTGVTLADITADFGIDEFVLIADIEGMEYELAQTELQLLQDSCSLVFVETHDIEDQEVSDFVELFHEAGFVQRDREADVWVFESTARVHPSER